ncbi:stage III sporulation protein SpoIIIAB [Paenibacillaceae sp. P-4]|uniref:stage III sporulation protein SpoIIIAB n=1 Tax=Paenibacillaceae bacterium P-4 TaxID=3160969 RepID=UPI0032E80485
MGTTYKLLGAAILVAATAGIGWVQAAAYAARPKQLRLLHHALARLETAIIYGHTPLSAAFHDIAQQMPPVLRDIFLSASQAMEHSAAQSFTAREAWEQAWERYGSNTSLTKEDLRIIKELGFTLGISDREDQSKHIKLAIKQLEQEEWSARENHSRYGKMTRSLGVLAGLLVVILMY